MLEGAVVGAVEGDHDRHDFTGRQPARPATLAFAGLPLTAPPKRYELLAKVIHATIQFCPIHSVFSRPASSPG